VPEYAHGLPGAFKNGLDWLVSDPAVLHKPVGIWNASARGEHAQASLAEVLRTMSFMIVEEAGLTLPLLDRPLTLAGLLEAPPMRQLLSDALAAFVRRIRDSRAG
jgi:chromate reductase